MVDYIILSISPFSFVSFVAPETRNLMAHKTLLHIAYLQDFLSDNTASDYLRFAVSETVLTATDPSIFMVT